MLLYRLSMLLLLSSNICAMSMNIPEAKKPGHASSAEHSKIKFDRDSFDAALQELIEMWQKQMNFCTYTLVDPRIMYDYSSNIKKQCQLNVNELYTFVMTMCCTGFRFPNMDQKEMDVFLKNPDEKNLEVLLAGCRKHTVSGDMLAYLQQCIGVTRALGECFNAIIQTHKESGRSSIDLTENLFELKTTMEMVVDYYLLGVVASMGIFQKMVKEDKKFVVVKYMITGLLDYKTVLYHNFRQVFVLCDKLQSLASDNAYGNFAQNSYKAGQAPQARWHQAFKVLSKALSN